MWKQPAQGHRRLLTLALAQGVSLRPKGGSTVSCRLWQLNPQLRLALLILAEQLQSSCIVLFSMFLHVEGARGSGWCCT